MLQKFYFDFCLDLVKAEISKSKTRSFVLLLVVHSSRTAAEVVLFMSGPGKGSNNPNSTSKGGNNPYIVK